MRRLCLIAFTYEYEDKASDILLLCCVLRQRQAEHESIQGAERSPLSKKHFSQGIYTYEWRAFMTGQVNVNLYVKLFGQCKRSNIVSTFRENIQLLSVIISLEQLQKHMKQLHIIYQYFGYTRLVLNEFVVSSIL